MKQIRTAGARIPRGVLPTLLCMQITTGSAAFAQGAPGALDVDPGAAERALERTLVRSGELLLPRGTFEIEPSLRYEHSETDGFILGSIDGDLVLDRQLIKRNEVTAALDLRYGLPGDAQIELTFPLIYADRNVEEGIFSVGEGGAETGLGDVSIGIAKTLLRESGRTPDLVGRLTWDTDWGEDSDGPVSVSSDFNEINASLSALWRIDPLAVTAGLAYEHAFEKDEFQPGDVVGVSLGASLAASPATSIGVTFNASYRAEAEFDGDRIDDSDQNQANLAFTFSNVLGRNALLSVQVGAGLTEDSPDYFVAIGIPIRW